MDVLCVRCGEPWEMDTLHDETEERFQNKPWLNEEGKFDQVEYEKYFNQVKNDFYKRGCVALGGFTCKLTNRSRREVIRMAYEFMGDDLDGAAAMLEDAEYLGLLE